MTLQGAGEVRAALRAMKLSFKDAGREWADQTAVIARTMVPSQTGATRASIRRRNATQRMATVVGKYTVNFIDAGAKEHDITARKMQALRFDAGGTTFFRRKVHKRAQAARPFKQRAGEEGLRRVDVLGRALAAWNRVIHR